MPNEIDALLDKFDLVASSNQHEPLHRPLDSTDPLAMACLYYRMGHEYGSLHSDEYYVEDVTLANAIRKYYKDTYTMSVLKGNTLTKYQQTVVGLITHSIKPTEEHTGLLHRLPYLYVEDINIDHVQSVCLPKIKRPHEAVIETIVSLDPIVNYPRLRGSSKGRDFWFKTDKGHAVRFYVSAPNPLLSFFENIVSHGKQNFQVTMLPAVHISGRNLDYYVINSIALAQ